MISSDKCSYRTLFWATAIAALVWWSSLPPAASARAQAADLTLEKQKLDAFAHELSTLEKNVAELQRKATITSAELTSVRTKASAFKSKVSQIQQTFQAAVNKLKAAGELDGLDEKVLAQLTEAKDQSLLRDAGGPRKVLQDAATQMSGLSMEIDALLQPLNAKVASTGFSFGQGRALGFVPARAAFAPKATVFALSLRCRFRIAAYILNDSRENRLQMACACTDGPPAPICQTI